MSRGKSLLLNVATLLVAAGSTQVQAQDLKWSGLVQVWYNQVMDSNLRNNSTSIAPNKYYNLSSNYQENGFTLRRTELKVSGKIMDGVNFDLMIDPSINTGSSNPTILQDAAIKFEMAPGLELKVGQFKNLQTYESTVSSSEIILAERNQVSRLIGEKRDRGAVLSYGFGDPKGFGTKLSVAVFNGMNDAVGGKDKDTNAAKDYVARLDMNVGKEHKFGLYTLQGQTNVKVTGLDNAPTTQAPYPTQAEIVDNKDKTSNMGLFYVYQDESIHLSAEMATGLLGRRFPTLVGKDGKMGREHLDQKFMGYNLTFGYTFGAHTLAARYDVLNYNTGDDWYTATTPYTLEAPEYKETTLGYTYALNPKKIKAANIKLNYIHRSENFLKPAAGQTGLQGGNTLMAALQIAF